jgi:O-antigen biosynthesis protein
VALSDKGSDWSVVIPTSNRPDQLDACLRRVSAVAGVGMCEVIVVDSRPAGDDARAVADAHGARYLAEPKGGASRARNVGARAVVSALILFLDDDAVPARGWDAALAGCFSDPAVMAAAGRVRPPESGTDSADFAAWFGLGHSGGQEARVVDRNVPHWFDIANFGGIGIGPNMAFRRTLFDGWPGFDERIGPGTWIAGAEEPKAFMEVIAAGHRVAYTPESVVLHPNPMPGLPELRRKYRRMLAASAAYMTMLLVEFPEHRAELLRYVRGSAMGAARPWRSGPVLDPPATSRAVRVVSYARGPVLYGATRLWRGPWPPKRGSAVKLRHHQVT